MAFIFPSKALLNLFPFLNAHAPTFETAHAHFPARAPQPLSFKLAISDADQTISGNLRFAGQNFPLPSGTWHPIITASADSDLSLMSLLREKEGKVTGFLTILATLHPIPSFMIPHIEDVKEKCHDDRIAAHWNAPTYRNTKVNCAFLAPVSPLQDPSIARDPFLQAGLSRAANDLAFEFPSIMLSREWLKIQTVPGKGRVFENVALWEVPLSAKISAETASWNNFFHQLSQNLPAWATKLSNAFDNSPVPPLPEPPLKTLQRPLSKQQAVQA